MKLGAKVWVCHDGKYSRRVEGEVVATRRGHHLQIKFFHEDCGEVLFWARRTPAVRYLKESGIFIKSRRPVSFGGWADIDWFMPWYSVAKWKDDLK